MSHDLNFVRAALGLLGAAGAQCWVFGGWAEEMQGLCPARAHHDVDLLYRAEDFAVVDRLLRDRALDEVEGKRFAHKRALLLDGVLIELFLVQRDDRGLFTSFWAQSRHDWPTDVLASASGLRVASAGALTGYRDTHSELRPTVGGAPQRAPAGTVTAARWRARGEARSCGLGS